MGSYEDDRWFYEQEDAANAFIESSLRSISRDNARSYLIQRGNDMHDRVKRCIDDAGRLRDSGFLSPAIVSAATAVEMTIRHLLVRPLVDGAFLSDTWAWILSDKILSKYRSAGDRQLLPAVLKMWNVDLEAILLPDGSGMWSVFQSQVLPKRNSIVHEAVLASLQDVETSIQCAKSILLEVVPQVIKELGIGTDQHGRWR